MEVGRYVGDAGPNGNPFATSGKPRAEREKFSTAAGRAEISG
ncbi:hypothetical protein X740_15075 [Mesorhizobium sp. LNHC221B00]|nr:hypothetical protein X740_15075 [Mesorhizobium sp. LNHC221B00]